MSSVSFEEWKEATFDMLEHVGKGLAATEDWMPVITARSPDPDKPSEERMNIFPLIDLDGNLDLGRQEGMEIVAAAILKMKPTLLSRSQMAWAAPEDKDNDYLPPSMREDRTEVLLVQIVDGPAGHSEVWQGTVERSGSHPVISEWKELTTAEGPLIEVTKRSVFAAHS